LAINPEISQHSSTIKREGNTIPIIQTLNCCTSCHTSTPSFSTIANIIMSGSNADDSYSTMDRWLDETHVHEPWNTVNRPHTSGSRDKSKDKGGSTSKGSKSKSRGKK